MRHVEKEIMLVLIYLKGSNEHFRFFSIKKLSHAGCCIITQPALQIPQSLLWKMTPGRMGGTVTDGEKPLERSVMKRSIENSLTVCAFQMSLLRVLCLIYFSKSHLIHFLHMYKPNLYRCCISKLFLFAGKY